MDCSEEYVMLDTEREVVQCSNDGRIERIKQLTDNEINYLTEKHIRSEQYAGDNDRRITILGLTGSGKSALGNRVLGYNQFESRMSPNSVTKCSQRGMKVRFGKNLIVTDTPGIDNTELTEEEVAHELANLVMMSAPGPHCFLLTIPVGPISPVFKKVISRMTAIFGEEMFNHTIAVFTKYDELVRENTTIEEYFNQNPDLSVIVEKCNRYATINNLSSNISQVQQLVEQIDDIVLHYNEGYYSQGCFKTPATAIEKQKQEKNKEEERKIQSAMKPTVDMLKSDIETLKEPNPTLQCRINQLEHIVENLQRNVETLHRDDKRHTRAIHKLTVDNSTLRDEICEAGNDRVCRYQGSHRQHPYDKNKEK